MTSASVPVDPVLLKAMQACLDHSKELLASARLIQESGRHNIAFHLAVLALEELGKKKLLAIKTIERSENWADKFFDDHIQKLFWCFFGAHISKERITGESLDALKGLATRLHGQRLSGLYVDIAKDGVSIPAERIVAAEAEKVISLAAARIDLEDDVQHQEIRSAEDIALQSWFLDATENPERRKFIFSAKSMERLAEFGNGKEWVLWIREEFSRVEAENLACAQREIDRGRSLNAGSLSGRKKWKIRIRLYTNSHSVRPKAINHWNQRVTWMKLIASTDKKDQLILEILLDEEVPVQSLWIFAWGIARSFVVALNLATMGFWFWRVPTAVSRYYESIEDIEHKRNLLIERQPTLKPDWGPIRALTPEDMDVLISSFICIPNPKDEARHAPFNYYIGGLTFLSLNDVHWQCESSALGNFFESHRAMMVLADELKPSMTFADAMAAFIGDMFPKMEEDKMRMLVLCKAFESGDLGKETVTLKDATFAKLFCDAYFLNRIRPLELRRLKLESEKGGEASAGG